MPIEQEYVKLLEKSNDKDIIGFLQQLSAEERKALAPLVKKLAKEYFAFHQHGNTWSSKANEKQRKILSYSFFACYNKKEIERENPAWLLSREHLEKLLPCHCPPWFSDYINGFADKGWLPHTLDYDYLIELSNRGFIQPVPQLIAKKLVPTIFEHKDRQQLFTPEKLLKYPATLEEHIWYLFQFETDVHTATRWLYGLEQKEQKNWETIFKTFVKEGKLDKQRILKESLLAANRNFNKNLSGWFADLFWQLEPSAEEILSLQPEIFNLFSSSHSKVVSAALQGCKSIYDRKEFDSINFLDHVPVILASDSKQVLAATLHLLEKLAKGHPDKRSQVIQLATGIFVHREESLQTRAAKLIQKWAGTENDELKQTLALHGDNMFSAARTLLQPFLAVEQHVEEALSTDSAEASLKTFLTSDAALPLIQDVDELVFLAAQAFDNNESWHIDLLPDALLRLNKHIKGEHLVKLEPAIQRALKFYFGDWRSTQGALDQLLACLFLDYCLWLIGQYPEQATSAMQLFKTHMYKSEPNKKIWDKHGINTTFLGGWKSHGEEQLYQPYQKLFNTIIAALKNRQELSLLCAPTHTPAWINPVVLVERLYRHQQQDTIPGDMDLQIAISRCWLHDTEAALQLVEKKLSGEWKALMLFLLNKDQRPIGPFTHEAAWMIAALTKSPQVIYPELAGLTYSEKPRELYTGQYLWKTFVEPYQHTDYSWKDGKMITTPVTKYRKVIRFDLSVPNTKTKETVFKKFIRKLTGSKTAPHPEIPQLIYDYMLLKGQWLNTEDRDIRRLYLLTPSNPEPVLAMTLQKCLSEATFNGETHKRFVIQVLQALHDTGMPSGEMAHLFLATCMIAADKTVAGYAAEIWMEGVQNNHINSELIGTMLGKHQQIEFAPLKRLTDLIMSNMLGISPRHNHQLNVLLTSMLKQLPPDPVKGLKKLVEIYLEVSRLNDSSIADKEVKTVLEKWKNNEALSKVIKGV